MFEWKWKYFILNYLYKMIPAFTYENNSWDFYLWLSQELHFQTLWSILNTPYGSCTLRTTQDWKKKKKPYANTNHPVLKSQLALLLPISALFCLCFLHPHVYMFAVGILHLCLLKIPWATERLKMVLCSISAGQHSAQQCEQGQGAGRRLPGECMVQNLLPLFLSNLLVWCSSPSRLNFLLLYHPIWWGSISQKPYALQAGEQSPVERRVPWLDVVSQNFSKPFISRAFHMNVHCKYLRRVSGVQIFFFFFCNVFKNATLPFLFGVHRTHCGNCY